MKRLFCLMILVMSFQASAFVALCGFAPEEGYVDAFVETESNHRVVYSAMGVDCFIKSKGEESQYPVTLKTFGPGLQVNGYEMMVITCPLVTQKRLEKVIKKKGEWKAVGVGASAGFLVGGRAGVAVNTHGAACAVAGLSFVGGGASVGVIDISFGPEVDSQE